MKKLTKLYAILAIAILIISYQNTNAQLNSGDFGFGASFVSISNQIRPGGYDIGVIAPAAKIHFAASPAFDISIGVLFSSVNYSIDPEPTGYKAPDAQTTIGFEGMFRFLLSSDKATSPYIGALINYTGFPKSTSTYSTYSSEITSNQLGFAGVFGCQTFISKSFAVYAHIAIGYSSYSETTKITYVTTAIPNTEVTEKYNAISLSGSALGAVIYIK
jgi:hypothetical protein